MKICHSWEWQHEFFEGITKYLNYFRSMTETWRYAVFAIISLIRKNYGQSHSGWKWTRWTEIRKYLAKNQLFWKKLRRHRWLQCFDNKWICMDPRWKKLKCVIYLLLTLKFLDILAFEAIMQSPNLRLREKCFFVSFVVQQHPTSLTTVRRNTQNWVRRIKQSQRKIESRHEDVTQEGESRG